MTLIKDQISVKAPDNAEISAIEAAKTRYSARPRRPKIKAQLSYGSCKFEAEHNDTNGMLGMILDSLATTSDDFANVSLNQMLNAMSDPSRPPTTGLNAALAVVASINARNEAEAQLGIQMAATHEAAMKMLISATRATDARAIDTYGNLATKLLRTYAAQMEALAKIRRGGEQKVTVEHVHVHEGGQAIVGSVIPGGREQT